MKFKALLSAALCTAAAFGAHAQTIVLTTDLPGTLSRGVENAREVTSLAINGPIDATDLFFIGENMPKLRQLDLSAAQIVELKGASVHNFASMPAGFIPAGSLSGLPLETFVFPTAHNTAIGDGAFMGTAFTELQLPASVDSIGIGAFAGCDKLQKVVMPAVSRMGSDVFANCTALVTVDMNGVTTIPAGTFRGCTALAEVEGAAEVENIGDRAFAGDAALTAFDFNDAIKHLGAGSFEGTGLTAADLSATSLKSLSDRAFAYSAVEDVKLPDDMTHIGDGAFFASNAAFVLPASTIEIGSHAFVGTTLPAEVTLNDKLETIGDYALAGQDKVETISLPASLIYLGSYAMSDMTGLKKINAGALSTVPELGEDVWSGVDQPSVALVVDEDMEPDFSSADQWKEFEIQKVTSVVDVIVDTDATTAVRGRFVGTDLELESTGAAMNIVRLYDASGRLLVTAMPQAATAVIDTASMPGGVYLVSVVLDDNSTASVKLARR